MFLISAKECTDTFLVGFPSHIRIEVTDYLLALINGVSTAKEQGKQSGSLQGLLSLTLGEDLLIK